MPTRRKKGGRRAGAGRKPVEAHVKQRNRVVCTFTDEELAKLEAVAGDEPLATYSRAVILRHLSRRKK